MNEDRYHELVLSKLDSLSSDVKDLRQECHSTFARQSDLAAASESVGKIDQRLEVLEKSYAALSGARSVEVGILRWVLGILAAIAGTVAAAWLLSR